MLAGPWRHCFHLAVCAEIRLTDALFSWKLGATLQSCDCSTRSPPAGIEPAVPARTSSRRPHMKRVLVIEASDRARFSLAVADGTVTVGPNPVLPELAFDNLHVLRVYCEVEVADDTAVISPATPDAAG